MIVASTIVPLPILNPCTLRCSFTETKYLFTYSVFFDEMMEFADRRFVSGCFCPEVDPDKFSHRLALVETIYRLRIRYIEPLLQEIDPQHSLNANRRTASLAQGLIGLN